MTDALNPQHYMFGHVQVIQITEQLTFNRGNVVKYVCRAGRKGDSELQDLQKALWYLEREIGHLSKPSKLMGEPV